MQSAIAAAEVGEQREGRRERRAREMRRKILLAAMALFSERGIDAVTVEEIADRADVARGTVFNHFASKETLCEAMGELHAELLEEAVRDGRIHGPSAAEKIRQMLQVMAEFSVGNPEHYRSMLMRGLSCARPGEVPEHKKRVFRLLRGWVEEGQQSGEFRSDRCPDELAGFLIGLQGMALFSWAYGFVGGSLVEHQLRVLGLAMEGIRTRDNA